MPDDQPISDEELAHLQAQTAHDAEAIAALRRQLEDAQADRRQDADAASALALRQSGLIDHLRDESDLHDGMLAAVQQQLRAAEHELDDLRAVRDALTPQELPKRPGLDFAVSFLPATQRVSGDFYLAAQGPDDGTVIVVGDVAGKGAHPAQRAAFVRTVFAAIARFSDDPCRLLQWTNTAMTERAGFTGRFATAACVTFDVSRRRIRWALAGHPPPLWLGTGEALSGASASAPLGVMEKLDCFEAGADLAPGDGILLYTDGLVAARRAGEAFGSARASAIVRELSGTTPQEIVARLQSEAAAFGGGELFDDLCVLAACAT